MISIGLFVISMVAEAAATTSAISLAPKDRVICRTYETTGSLARTKRICRTAREWDDAAKAARDSAERLQENGRIAQGNPNGG